MKWIYLDEMSKRKVFFSTKRSRRDFQRKQTFCSDNVNKEE